MANFRRFIVTSAPIGGGSEISVLFKKLCQTNQPTNHMGPGVPPSETVGRVTWRLCCPCGQAEPPRAGSPLLGSLGTATGIDWTTACPTPAHSAMPP